MHSCYAKNWDLSIYKSVKINISNQIYVVRRRVRRKSTIHYKDYKISASQGLLSYSQIKPLSLFLIPNMKITLNTLKIFGSPKKALIVILWENTRHLTPTWIVFHKPSWREILCVPNCTNLSIWVLKTPTNQK